MKKMTLTEFRLLVRKLVIEYVSKDDKPGEPNFNKDAHSDPSRSHMDAGLDEAEEDYTDTHGGKKRVDPRWEKHADPTMAHMDVGLDEMDGMDDLEIDSREGLCTGTNSNAPFDGMGGSLCDMSAEELVDGDPFCAAHAKQARRFREREQGEF